MNPQGKPEVCEKKKALLAAHEEALQQYMGKLQELRAKMATSPRDEYERLRRAVERARSISEHARIALERHVREHGC